MILPTRVFLSYRKKDCLLAWLIDHVFFSHFAVFTLLVEIIFMSFFFLFPRIKFGNTFTYSTTTTTTTTIYGFTTIFIELKQEYTACVLSEGEWRKMVCRKHIYQYTYYEIWNTKKNTLPLWFVLADTLHGTSFYFHYGIHHFWVFDGFRFSFLFLFLSSTLLVMLVVKFWISWGRKKRFQPAVHRRTFPSHSAIKIDRHFRWGHTNRKTFPGVDFTSVMMGRILYAPRLQAM